MPKHLMRKMSIGMLITTCLSKTRASENKLPVQNSGLRFSQFNRFFTTILLSSSLLTSSALASDRADRISLESEAQKSPVTFPRILNKTDEDHHIILSIDGGGTRGAIPARVLQRLVQDLSAYLLKNTPEIQGLPKAPDPQLILPYCLSSLFDAVVGTSTGGIIAAGLATPHPHSPYLSKFTTDDIMGFYKNDADKIFPPGSGAERLVEGRGGFGILSPKYSEKPLEEILKENFGDVELKDAFTRLILTTVNLDSEKLKVLDSRMAQQDAQGQYHNFYMRDGARATSAAPVFLSSAVYENMQKDVYHSVDGGVLANNPSLIGYAHYLDSQPKAKIIVLSLGCGASSEDKLSDLGKRGAVHWASKFPGLAIGGAAASCDEIMHRLQSTGTMDYIRLQLELSGEFAKLDNAEKEQIRRLKGKADEVIDTLTKSTQYKRILDVLKEELHRRQHYIMARMIEALAPTLSHGSLAEVSLNKLWMGDRGLWEVSRFLIEQGNGLAGVETFDLTANNLSDESVSILLQYPNLKKVVLDGNNLTLKGLEQLLTHPTLKEISIKSSGILLEASLLDNPQVKKALLQSSLTLDLRENGGRKLTAFIKKLSETNTQAKIIFEWLIQEAWYQKLLDQPLSKERLEKQLRILDPYKADPKEAGSALYLMGRIYGHEAHDGFLDKERFKHSYELYYESATIYDHAPSHFAIANLFASGTNPEIIRMSNNYMADYRQDNPDLSEVKYKQEEQRWRTIKNLEHYEKASNKEDWLEVISRHSLVGPVQALIEIALTYEKHCGTNYFGLPKEDALEKALRYYERARQVYEYQKKIYPKEFQAYEETMKRRGFQSDLEEIEQKIEKIKKRLNPQ